jgi:hypothetical protein
LFVCWCKYTNIFTTYKIFCNFFAIFLQVMERKDKLNAIYSSLVDQGRCKNKKEFAALLGVNYNGLTRAMNGDAQYLTGSLVSKATALAQTGEELFPDETEAGSVLPGAGRSAISSTGYTSTTANG